MRIAFVIGSLGGGGAERVVAMLANKLVDMGHEVSIISIASTDKTYYVSEHVKLLYCIKNYKVPGISFIRRVVDLKKTLQNYNPSVSVSFTVAVNIYSIFASIGQKWRLIICERNDPKYDPQNKTLRILRRLTYNHADGYVFQTDRERDYFSEHIRSKSWVIPNPINSAIGLPFSGRRQKRFVTAVRLEPQKNLKLAIDAFRVFHTSHNDYTFDIYGEGALHDELQDYIDEKGLNKTVFLRGRSNTLYEDINNSYAFILSSDYEGMSNSMLEAMALGLPVICTDYPSGGARMVISDHINGILIPVGDKESLIEAMRELADNEQMSREIGKRAEEIRQKLSVDQIMMLWEKCLFDLR